MKINFCLTELLIFLNFTFTETSWIIFKQNFHSQPEDFWLK